MRAFALLVALALSLAFGASCAAPPRPSDPLDAMRADAKDGDGEALGKLLLGEMFAPGGDPARARAARARLDRVTPRAAGLYASYARAIDDDMHGRTSAAADDYLAALSAARTARDANGELIAWFSASHLLALRASVARLWERARAIVNLAIDDPGNIGWRARGELVEWWSVDGVRELKGGPPPLEASAAKFGCAENARIAGPFGHMAPADHRKRWDAEKPGPWPLVFAKDPQRLDPPRVMKVDRVGCALHAEGGPGVYYVETYLDMPAEREAILAVQGELALFVDDTEVLTRDTREFGIWPRFGAHVRLAQGRHRVLARVAGPDTSIRVLAPDGAPLGVTTSSDPAPPYAIAPPVVEADPNALGPWLADLGVPPPPNAPKIAGAPEDPIGRAIASYVAHIEGQDDVASVLLQPLISDPKRATGPALAFAAVYFEKDPIYSPQAARDAVKDARAEAAKKDPELWWPRLWLVIDEAEKQSVADSVPKIQELADHFREVPEIVRGLAAIQGKLGWKVEHDKTVREAAKRFPDDVESLHALMRLDDETGDTSDADAIAKRIKDLDPDAEVEFERAIERRDYAGAIAELKRLGTVRKDRRDIAARVADLLARAGAAKESREMLEAAVKKSPEDGGARLALADARFASGDRGALNKELIDAIHAGADTQPLREAIELLDGIHELTAYRLDGKQIIKDYEASGRDLPGIAARVLDYSAIWIHPDGSARMLEHEILCIQSSEGIQQQAEQRPHGLVLKLHTIKKDGTVLEPEVVEGKPTVTMPHLEVGDYIETETVTSLRGDGLGGRRFEGPHWLFREEKIPYFRSEFVVVSPKNRPLVVEVGGRVPPAEVKEEGALVVRRWRVDKSPALPEEPWSAPIQEFIPSVRIGWGITLADQIAQLVDAASDETPRDPRILRIAEGIAANDLDTADARLGRAPASLPKSADERARRVYRWVLANVESGRDPDPRRTITGKTGNRVEAFLHLCRLLGVEASIGVVKDRLAPPPLGPMSEVEEFNDLAVRVVTEHGPKWMTLREKFAPYGYLPSSLRGQPAIVLVAGAPRETTPAGGPEDGVTNDGSVDLHADGSATIDLEQRYGGKFGIALREALQHLPEASLKKTIEGELLRQTFPGARLLDFDVKNGPDLDEPLTLKMKLELSRFAARRGDELAIDPPFPIHVARLAQATTRETPLYLGENIATTAKVRLAVKLPAKTTLEGAPENETAQMGFFAARAADRAADGTLTLDRFLDIPAGRVQPDDYPKFVDFARRADAALHREVVLKIAAP